MQGDKVRGSGGNIAEPRSRVRIVTMVAPQQIRRVATGGCFPIHRFDPQYKATMPVPGEVPVDITLLALTISVVP